MPKGKRKFYVVDIGENKKLSVTEFDGEAALRDALEHVDTKEVAVFSGKHLPIRTETRLVIGDGTGRRGRPPGAPNKAKGKK